MTRGFAGGELDCNNDCTVDDSSCEVAVADCDNGIKAGSEECDTNDFDGRKLASHPLGFDGGNLGCNSDCTL